MERISDVHLDEMKRFLERNTQIIGTLSEAVKKYYKWEQLPSPQESAVYAVDGSRMIKRLSGAIIYAVSAAAIGKTLHYWNDIGMLYPYSNVEDRVRIHMDILEKRMGAIAYELGGDLVLMDGTLRSAIIRPPTYIDSTRTKELRDKHGSRLLEAVLDFIELLDKTWGVWKKELKEKGVISTPSLLSRGLNGRDIFTLLMEHRSKVIQESLWWTEDMEDLLVLFEYIEYLHALDKLLGCDIGAIAKTFYKSEIIKKVMEHESDFIRKSLKSRELLNIAEMIVDTPVISAISNKAGYLKFNYSTGPKKALPRLIIDVMEAGKLKNLRETLVLEGQNIVGAKITPAYVRFADGGLIYLLEIPERQEFEETLSKILSVSEDEYVVPLEYAHHAVVIKKPEFEAYVNAILSALVSEDERFLSFLRYGREPLE